MHEIEKDIQKLTENMAKMIIDIVNVETEEDAELFDETHDAEEGLIHIRLF